jgi:hypothetical protein
MNQQLESDLRHAFALRVSGIPAETGERLRGIDYHPRTGRIPARLTAGAMVGAAATTTAVVSVVVLGGSQAAFAGWSASPASAGAAPAPAPGAGASCQARLAAAPTLPDMSAGGTWSAVATDVRGPFTLVIYENGDAHATCLTGPSITVVSQNASNGKATSGSMSVSQTGGQAGNANGSVAGGRSWAMVTGTGNGSTSGPLKNVVVAHLASTSQGPYTLVEGQADPDVTGVTIVRSDGEQVQTTIDNGWFLAWWPGTQGATSAQITTSAGVITEVFNTNTPLPPPPANGSCAQSPQTPSATTVCSGGADGGGPGAPSAGTP